MEGIAANQTLKCNLFDSEGFENTPIETKDDHVLFMTLRLQCMFLTISKIKLT